jgi:hypothetical protein
MKQKPEPIAPVQPLAAPPSNGVTPAPASSSEPDRECFRCGKGGGTFYGPVILDRYGFWLHAACRVSTELEMAPWRR